MNFEKILPEQSSVKVVLNGGHENPTDKEIDDATIPFTIGFDRSITEREPTHVLVIDIPSSTYTEKKRYDYLKTMGERKIYELTKIDFVQFHESGKHHLIFILFKNLDQDKKKKLLQKDTHTMYDYAIDLQHPMNIRYNPLGYCEELVEIPKEFFAEIPQTGLKKKWWAWVNRWFLTDPIDECEFRKRVILAVTIQPIAWFLGFVPRLISAIVLLTILPVFMVFSMLCGGQPTPIVWKNIGAIGWQFLFLYTRYSSQGWGRTWDISNQYFDSSDYFKLKHFKIASKEFKLPISVVGACIQILLWYTYSTSLAAYFMHWYGPKENLRLLSITTVMAIIGVWHATFVLGTVPYKKFEEWVGTIFDGERKGVIRIWLICAFLVLVSLVSIMATQINWYVFMTHATDVVVSWRRLFLLVSMMVFIWFFGRKSYRMLSVGYDKVAKWLMHTSFVQSLKNKKKEAKTVLASEPIRQSKQPYKVWLADNMDINQLPSKVNINDITAPTKAKQRILSFKVSFWRAKAKVCKPYVR